MIDKTTAPYTTHERYWVTNHGTSRTAPLNNFTNECLPIGMTDTNENVRNWGQTAMELSQRFCTVDRVPQYWRQGCRENAQDITTDWAREMVRPPEEAKR